MFLSPDDHARVHLSTENSITGSDYVNASYIVSWLGYTLADWIPSCISLLGWCGPQPPQVHCHPRSNAAYHCRLLAGEEEKEEEEEEKEEEDESWELRRWVAV